MEETLSQELLQFIEECPTAFQTVEAVAKRLEKEGYLPLQEGDPWKMERGGKYYVTRNRSSLIGFQIPKGEIQSLMMTAAHGDAPALKLKPVAEMKPVCGGGRWNVEKYGGMLLSTWMDRPLSVAGRVTVRTKEGMETRLVHIKQDLALIPNLAIHMNPKANEGMALNPQVDMLPLWGKGEGKGILSLVAEEAGVSKEEIVGSDLFLYCRSRGCVWGTEGEFLSAPRLDDLACVFASLQGFLSADDFRRRMSVLCVFDNEEVGSGTKQGACSDFLADTLQRICDGLGLQREDYLRILAGSFLLSADNGHALHPNHPEKADPTHQPCLNGGVLLKVNANQKYTTDAVSEGFVRSLCQEEGIPVQYYVNRSDVAGGSTLGNLSAQKVAVNTADIGVAQLAMHSAYETMGKEDLLSLCRCMTAFYHAELSVTADGSYKISF